jgi:glutathione S-transferase
LKKQAFPTGRACSSKAQDKPEYRGKQPFGQVPIFEQDGFVLFETGAIVLHIGEKCETLLPREPAARDSRASSRGSSALKPQRR